MTPELQAIAEGIEEEIRQHHPTLIAIRVGPDAETTHLTYNVQIREETLAYIYYRSNQIAIHSPTANPNPPYAASIITWSTIELADPQLIDKTITTINKLAKRHRTTPHMVRIDPTTHRSAADQPTTPPENTSQ